MTFGKLYGISLLGYQFMKMVWTEAKKGTLGKGEFRSVDGKRSLPSADEHQFQLIMLGERNLLPYCLSPGEEL